MGFAKQLFTLIFKIAVYAVILFGAILFIPGIPPTHVRFESFTIEPARKLEDKLAPNSILNHAQVLKVDRELDGPESLSIRGDELFFGDKKGQILKVKNGQVKTVLDLEGFPCSHIARPKCSYPLGTRFSPKSGKLVFTDIYGGLLQVNVDTGSVEKLIARGEVIEGHPVGFPEDLDVAKDGAIYWSDGTTTATIETMWNELLGHPSGRLMKYDPSTNKSTVLLNGLHFANGVQLSNDEEFVLVGESVRCQIRRYYLKGKKAGQSDMFIDGLPWYPDNIRPNGKGGFYVSMFSPRIDTGLEELAWVRKLLARTLFLMEFITARLYAAIPTEFTESLNQMVVSITQLKPTEPLNGFVIELSKDGEIIGSVQSTNGILYGISQITVGEKYAYLTSPSNTKVWVVNTKDLRST